MSLGSFAHDALSDLTSDDLARMLTLNETLFVEHKMGVGDEGAHGLMKAVSSFANTLGGWLLLGVHNGKPLDESPDWAQESAPPLVDFVRDGLRQELDPLPAFEAKVMALPDGPLIGVVRVYESTDTPHISIRSGAVYVREAAGDRDVVAAGKAGPGLHGERVYRAVQIRNRAQLLDLAQRGKVAADRVSSLFDLQHRLPLVANHLPINLEPLPWGGFQPEFDASAAIVARLAPHTLSPRFRGWTTTADCAAALLAAAEDLADRHGLSPDWAEPDPSGVAVHVPLDIGRVHSDAANVGLSATAHMVADGAGLVGAALELGLPENPERRSWIRLSTIANEFIQPVVKAAVSALITGEFLGRARCQIDLLQIPRVFLLDEGGQNEGRAWIPSGAELQLPADNSEINAVAQRAANTFGRSAGIRAWDSPA